MPRCLTRRKRRQLLTLFSLPGGEPAFFGMREEAELLVAARAAHPAGPPVLWGVDYEVAGDRTLLRDRCSPSHHPNEADAPLSALVEASNTSWHGIRDHAQSGESVHF